MLNCAANVEEEKRKREKKEEERGRRQNIIFFCVASLAGSPTGIQTTYTQTIVVRLGVVDWSAIATYSSKGNYGSPISVCVCVQCVYVWA